MLVSLTVRNIALIESLTVQFHRGLHVLTGETGAGKSIVVDAINLALGERADRGLIRTGCEKATVEALMDISDSPEVRQMLQAEGLEAEGDLMSILREVYTTDRNICRICGVIMPISFLKQISAHLVDVHGQHEHQSLLEVRQHMAFLDSFGEADFLAQKKKTADAFHTWKECSARFSSLRKENAQREQRQEYISARCIELEDAKLQPGEADALAQERAKFAGAERINRAVELAYHEVYMGEGSQRSVTVKLDSAIDAMQGIVDLDPAYQTLVERLQSVYYEAEEIGIELRDVLEKESFDPDRNEEVQDRLDLIRRLERKYGMTADELIPHAQELRRELDELESMDDLLRDTEAEYKQKLAAYRAEAVALTELRKRLATRFEGLMMEQLRDLGMEKTRFEVVFTEPGPDQKRVPTEQGDDHVEFFISPNPGEPLKPLSKTASGGELSRLMLAMKAAAADRNLIPCMIFDEIDTGISGYIAGVVAEKMADIARYRQVICVTHLSQIAAMADTQYFVQKEVVGERTVTHLRELDAQGRVQEVGRLVGMGEHSDSAIAHAANMIASAAQYKRQMSSRSQNGG